MTWLIFHFVIMCVFIFVQGINSTEISCGPNEMEVDCPASCESDYCPTSNRKAAPCRKIDPCPEPASQCIFNHRRAKNGTCIPTERCPPFPCNGRNEVYTSCPPLCTDNCTGATLSGDCPPTFGFISIVLPCTPTCRCQKHYWRKDGSCVRYSQC